MRETFEKHDDPEYSHQWSYEFNEEPGACIVKRVWVDGFGSFWLESIDGQRVLVPDEARRLIAKKMKEATFR